jgi:hypothetical protein
MKGDNVRMRKRGDKRVRECVACVRERNADYQKVRYKKPRGFKHLLPTNDPDKLRFREELARQIADGKVRLEFAA